MSDWPDCPTPAQTDLNPPNIAQSFYIALLTDEVTFAPSDVNGVNWIPTLFQIYAQYAALAPQMVYLYAKRHCVEKSMSGNWQIVTLREEDETYTGGQLSTNLQAIYDRLTAEIVRLTMIASANVPPVLGEMFATAPICPGGLGPNGRRFRGDPIWVSSNPQNTATPNSRRW